LMWEQRAAAGDAYRLDRFRRDGSARHQLRQRGQEQLRMSCARPRLVGDPRCEQLRLPGELRVVLAIAELIEQPELPLHALRITGQALRSQESRDHAGPGTETLADTPKVRAWACQGLHR